MNVMEALRPADRRNNLGKAFFNDAGPIQMSCQNRVVAPFPTLFLIHDVAKDFAGELESIAEQMNFHGPPFEGIEKSSQVKEDEYPYLLLMICLHRACGSEKKSPLPFK